MIVINQSNESNLFCLNMVEMSLDFQQFLQEFDINQVVLIQTCVRGWLVRKWMRKVKDSYRRLVAEVESNPLIDVTWTSHRLSAPKISMKLKLSSEEGTVSSTKKENTESQSLGQRPKNIQPVRHCHRSDVEIQTSTSLLVAGKDMEESSSTVTGQHQLHCVETQTSLVEASVKPLSNSVGGLEEPMEHFLDDIDTSWKDFVAPFVDKFAHNGIGQDSNARDRTELHLKLLSSEENTPRSDEARHSPRSDTSDPASNVVDQSVTRVGDTRLKSDRSSSTSLKTKRPSRSDIPNRLEFDSSSVRSEQNDQRSSRSDQSGKTRSLISPRSDRHALISESHDVKGRCSDKSNNIRKHNESKDGASGQRLDRSEYQRSDRSNESDMSRSGRSQTSDRQQDGVDVSCLMGEKSRPTDKSKHQQSSDGSTSGRSQKSNQSGGSSGKSPYRRSLVTNKPLSLHSGSPAEQPCCAHEDVSIHGNRRRDKYLQDTTSLTNVTSVWDISNNDSHIIDTKPTLPKDAGQLQELRKNIALELLWVQQAIHSRKNYLRLKGEM